MSCNRCEDIHRGQLFGHSNKQCRCDCHSNNSHNYLGHTRVSSVQSVSKAVTPSRAVSSIVSPKSLGLTPTIKKPYYHDCVPEPPTKLEGKIKRLREIKDELLQIIIKRNLEITHLKKKLDGYWKLHKQPDIGYYLLHLKKRLDEIEGELTKSREERSKK